MPLILATRTGAVSRVDIGLVIATGMSVGTLFTLFVLPCVYTWVEGKIDLKVIPWGQRLQASLNPPHKN